MLIAHVQYVGAETMSFHFFFFFFFFFTGSRATGHKFQGLVTSTLRPLESQCTKDADIFVTTFHQSRSYTDEWGNLNFIIGMKKLTDEEPKSAVTKADETRNINNTTTTDNNNIAAPAPVPMEST